MSGLTLTVGGQSITGWTEFTVSRSLTDLCSKFVIGVTQRLDQSPWPLRPFQPCTLSLDGVLVLTGYIDAVSPALRHNTHTLQVSGRSRTADLVDCSPDVPSGQFTGYDLGQIARALAALYSINVVEATATDITFPDATIYRAETAYRFLERLCRLSGVLATDDANGNLVLTTTGSVRAAGRLVQGVNVVEAHGVFSGVHRFSKYIIKGQTSIGAQVTNWSGAGGNGQAAAATPQVLTAQVATASDPGVPRPRTHVAIAESMLSPAGMQMRANWMARFQAGRAATAEATVSGWHQPDGSVWTTNQLVACHLPFLALDQDLLVSGVAFILDKAGARTRLTLGAPDGFAPDPGQVKLHRRGRGKAGVNWSGAANIQ